MAARCVQGQLDICVFAKQRFQAAVADAAQSAKVKISSKIDHEAGRLLAQGDALWATWWAALAASSGAVEQRIDVALVAGIAVVQTCCFWLA
jgi:diphthamide biosynthesis methyltransferase